MIDEAEDLLGGPVPYQQPPPRHSKPAKKPNENTHGRSMPPELPTLTGRALAALLGVNVRTISTLAADGHLVKLGTDTFDRDESVRTYCAHLRGVAAGRIGGPNLTDQRTRVAREQADALELKNAASRREFLNAREVENEWAAILRDIRSAFLAVPTRIQQQIGSLSASQVAIIDREIRDVLKETGNATA